MSELRVARRYASAAISVAEEMNNVDAVSKDFALIEKLLHDVRDFGIFMRSPVVNTEKKKTVLMNVLRGNIGEFTLKFVLLLTPRGREGILRDVIKEFYRLRDEHRNTQCFCPDNGEVYGCSISAACASDGTGDEENCAFEFYA